LAEVDREKINKLVSELRKALRLLQELQARDRGEFLRSEHEKSSAKYNFIVAVEAAIDICNHLIAALRLRAPDSYADTFKVLQEAGAFTADFSARLMDMARFRNRLLHFYLGVDDDMLWEILQEGPADLEAFTRALGDFLKRI
jgi:uncharacterized protein YutE (UPF0331/DUF86 family)